VLSPKMVQIQTACHRVFIFPKPRTDTFSPPQATKFSAFSTNPNLKSFTIS
jgi:hypothetical protein